MVSKHETYLLPGRNEGRSKSTFRQLRISTLWTSKGYQISISLKLHDPLNRHLFGNLINDRQLDIGVVNLS